MVIAHQHPSMNPPAGHRAGVGQGGEEKPAAVVVMENGLTPVTTRHHVVKSAGKFNASLGAIAADEDRRQACEDLHTDPIFT